MPTVNTTAVGADGVATTADGANAARTPQASSLPATPVVAVGPSSGPGTASGTSADATVVVMAPGTAGVQAAAAAPPLSPQAGAGLTDAQRASIVQASMRGSQLLADLTRQASQGDDVQHRRPTITAVTERTVAVRNVVLCARAGVCVWLCGCVAVCVCVCGYVAVAMWRCGCVCRVHLTGQACGLCDTHRTASWCSLCGRGKHTQTA